MISRLLVGVAVLAPLAARADAPIDTPQGGALLRGPAQPDLAIAIDPGDLPPLPETGDAPSSSATVLAAASAEEDVVVGVAKREQTLGNVASAVTVISADRIRRFGYRTVGEAIAGVAGAYLEADRLVESLGIRGINIPGDFNTRILVLIDGATVNEAWGSFAGLGYDTLVAIDEIARIEVIRGPVSSVYGANAFFGIINIVTRGAAESTRAYGRAAINSIHGVVSTAGFAAGTVHRQVRGSIMFDDRIGEPLLHAPVTPDGPGVTDARAGDGSLGFTGSLVGSYEGSFAQLRAYRNRRSSPFAPYNSDPSVDVPYTEYNTQVLIEGGHTRDLSKQLTVSARGYVNLYEFRDHIIQLGMSPFDDYGDGNTYGAELRGRYELVPGKLGITGGGEASYLQTESRSFTEGMEADQAKVDRTYDIEGVYTELDGQPLPWLGFTGGVRYDRNSAIDNRLSPRAALFVAEPEHYGVKLLYAEGFRNPSAYEAFFHDDVSFQAPDKLRAETIRSFEAVAWAKPAPGIATRLSGFYWSARGVVEALPAPTPIAPGILQFQNVGRFVSTGVEAEASYRDSAGWYAFGGATYARVGAAEDAGAVAFGHVVDAPAITAAGGVSTPELLGLGHAGLELLYIGARPVRPDGDGKPLPDAPAWLGVNLTLFAPAVHGFDITAGVRNLIGTRNQVPAPADYDRLGPSPQTIATVPGEGREVYLKVGYAY